MLVKPKQDNEINNKLEKLRILLPVKTDEQLLALLEIQNWYLYNGIINKF